MHCILCKLFHQRPPRGEFAPPTVGGASQHLLLNPGRLLVEDMPGETMSDGPWFQGSVQPQPAKYDYIIEPSPGASLDELSPPAWAHDRRGVNVVGPSDATNLLTARGVAGHVRHIVRLLHWTVSGPMAAAAKGRFHPIVGTSLTIDDTRMPQLRVHQRTGEGALDSGDLLARARDGILQALYGQ